MMYRKDTCGNTQDELIKDIHYDKGAMTRTMKSLEKKGYVERNNNPLDSRSFIFSLTEKDNSFKHIIIDILRQWNVQQLKGICEENLALVEESLETMALNSFMYFSDKSFLKLNRQKEGK